MKKTLFLLLALSGISVAATAVSGTPYYAATSGSSGDVTVTLDSGTTGSTWAGAFGSSSKDDDTREGDITLKMSGSYSDANEYTGYTGSATVFGAVNSVASSTVEGDVTLIFDAPGAEYNSFTDVYDEKNKAASVVGAYQSKITGTFSVNINSGTFNYDIIGGGFTSNSSIGATSITINGGNILDDVYAGGISGTIEGDTSITISSLDAFESHTSTNLISAGGRKVGTETGGTIGGDATVTFKNIASGSYAGTVSGGSNVAGTSTLNVVNSTLSLAKVEGFDSINIDTGSNLTVTGNITTKGTVNVGVDAATVATKTDNGLGRGIVSGLVSGGGTFALGDSATINGKSASYGDGNIYMDEAVYYVMNSSIHNAPESPVAQRTGAVYSLGTGKEVLLENVVHVGTHNYAGPAATAGANEALGYYVGENGALCIMADVSESKTSGDILASVQGTGSVFIRTAGYTNSAEIVTHEVCLNKATVFEGDLYLAPQELAGDASVRDQAGVYLRLQDGADISSFDNVYVCYQYSTIIVDGVVGRSSDQVGHINNLQSYGSSYAYLYIDAAANKEFVLGGTTELKSHTYGLSQETGSTLYICSGKDDSTVTIEHLSGTETTGLIYSSDMGDTIEKDNPLNVTLNIDSFDFRGLVTVMGGYSMSGSIGVNITLQDEQWIRNGQYKIMSPNGSQAPSVTLKGTGTYILDEGADIKVNRGSLSREVDADGEHIWQGTVQLTNVDATSAENGTGHGIDYAYYGNSQSRVDFRGFKGEVVEWTPSGTVAETQPDAVDIAPALILTNTDTMNAYEVTGGIATQNYLGDISGEGDFVVNSADSLNINLKGNINEWKGNLKTADGTHAVTITNAEAVTVQGAVIESGGTMNLKVETAAGTTFKNTVKVNSLTVSERSLAKLAAESTAGGVKIKARGAEVAELGNGLSIADSAVRGGSIRNAAITSTAAGEVELSGLTAENLYLYGGEDVEFASAATEEFVFDAESNEVNFSSDVFKGMTLSSDGAGITLQVNPLVDGLTTTDVDKVTIFLEGFKMEGLAGSGEWSWEESKLNFNGAMTYNLGDTTTVQQLLMAEYQSITYTQGVNGLTIRMSNIPEPSTVSLSLLALAGLVMRRKRK